MIKRLRIVSIFFIMISMFIYVPGVSAHPLGNFTINHFSEIHISEKAVQVDYVLDMAEIPAFQEISLLDKNHNGKADVNELAGYPARQCETISQQLVLQHNGASIPLSLASSQIAFPPGAGGLSTLRLNCTFQGSAVKVAAQDHITYQDHSYSDRLGWREVVVTADGISLSGDFATKSVSNKLVSYPKDLLTSPLDVREVSIQVGVGKNENVSGTTQASRQDSASNWLGNRSDRFTQLITLQDLTPASILFALLISVIWGGLHALTPGHGKTIVGAYLVGSRGTARHAIYLGLMTTITHTAGVFTLGMLTFFASRYIVPERLFPWISALSGMLVIVIGLSLMISRLRQSKFWKNFRKPNSDLARFGSITLAKERIPQHMNIELSAARLSGAASSTPGQTRASIRTSHMIMPHEHTHNGQHDHTHGPGGHTHLPPPAEDGTVTWRGLLALGVSCGILPCPSALVVLLGAIALNRIGFGIILVLAFSLGLAGVLTGIGLALVYARRIFEKVPVRSRFFELIPAGSALFITILGAGITVNALAQIGWIRF